MEEKKSLTYIVLAVIVVAVFGWLFISGGDSNSSMTGGESTSSSDKKASATPQLAPALQLTKEEKAGNVSEKKASIMARVNSETPLTQEEKAEIGGIMLTKGEVYKFTEAERQAIFVALSKK